MARMANASNALRRMHRFWNFPFRLNGDVPLSSGKRDCHLFRRSLYFAAVAVAYPPDFGKEYAAVAFVQLEALRIAKSIVKTFLLETWEPSTLLKEVFVGSIEVFQGLLQNLRMGFRKKRSSVFLLPIPKGFTEQEPPQTLPFVFIGFLFQCKRLVPNKTATSGKAPHEAFLPGFGAELKLIGLQSFHNQTILGLWKKSTIFALEDTVYFFFMFILVFITKYRYGVFTKAILDDLKEIFASVCQDFEAELVEFDGEDDHINLLVMYPPKVSISSLVNSLKGVSSRLIRKKGYPSIQKKLWGSSLWSPSYFAGSCGGAPISILKQYIEAQRTPKIKDKIQVKVRLISPP